MYSHPHAPWGYTSLDCRRFLARAAALGASLPLIRFGLPAALAEDEPQLVARRVFFDNPDFGSVCKTRRFAGLLRRSRLAPFVALPFSATMPAH